MVQQAANPHRLAACFYYLLNPISMLYKYRYLLYSVIGLPIILMLLFIVSVFFHVDNYSNIDKGGEDIAGIFTKYNNKIYASVPSNGYYELTDVQAKNFVVIDNSRYDSHIGKDDKNVFAGNLVIDDLNPNNVYSLGNNYYTDGQVTYYCNRNSKKNTSLNTVIEILQLTAYNLQLGNKPQSYWYPFVRLPDNVAYKSINFFGMAVSEDKVYFQGEEMPKANPKTMQVIYDNTPNGARVSENYFTDGEHVYFRQHLLDINYHPAMYDIHIDGDYPSRNAYLFDPTSGNVVVDGQLFPKENAPYKLMSNNLKHAYQVLFASKEGIYAYDPNDEAVERIGANPFHDNEFTALYGDVLKSSNKVYFIAAHENRSKNGGTTKRSTTLQELEGVNANDLELISSTEGYTPASVWKANNQYLLFDNLGSSPLIKGTIFAFNNPEDALALAKKSEMREQDIRELIENKRLVIPESETIVTATTKYNSNNYYIVYIILGVILALYAIVMLVYNNKTLHPYFFKDNDLIVHTLLYTKYSIPNIKQVQFFIKVQKSGRENAHINFRIQTKDGKTSRRYLYSPKVSFQSYTKGEMIVYVIQLRQELDQKHIPSSLQVY